MNINSFFPKDMTLPLSVYLDKENTKLVGDKNSTMYKTVIEILKFIQDQTGIRIPVIGTKKDGTLFMLNVD